MTQQANGPAPALTARQLGSPAALALADLAAIFDDLQFVLGCCERLVAELGRGAARDEVVIEALWVAALNAYARCFRAGDRGMGLSVADLKDTGLKGDLVEWHALLGRLRGFLIEGATNPRETFSVGASQSAEGKVDGIVITSVTQPRVDETTVRQTGRLAFELSKVLDERIKKHQQTVFTAAQGLPADTLNGYPPMDVVVPPDPPPTES